MKKLFFVRCRGMQTALGEEVGHGVGYVVAEDPTSAYEAVRKDLEARNLGFEKERMLHSVELIAEANDYSAVAKLYL